MKRLLLLTISIFTFLFTNAQEGAPTLSFGLDQVLFGKGTLDVEVIAEIIAEKQDELKKRIIEKEILEPMFENSSFTTRNYVFSVVKNLMYEKDKNVLKKEVLEHTANYALVYTLAEMYVQYSWDSIRTENSYFKFIKVSDKSVTLNCLGTINNYGNNDYSKFKLSLLDEVSVCFKEKATDTEVKTVKFNNLLLDMILHSVRSNPVFIKRGFCGKPLYFNIDDYRLLSSYQTLGNKNLKDQMYQNVDAFVNDIAQNAEIFEDLLQFISEQKESASIKEWEKSIRTKTKKISSSILDDFLWRDYETMLVKDIAYLKDEKANLISKLEKYSDEWLFDTTHRDIDYFLLNAEEQKFSADSVDTFMADIVSLNWIKENLESNIQQLNDLRKDLDQQISDTSLLGLRKVLLDDISAAIKDIHFEKENRSEYLDSIFNDLIELQYYLINNPRDLDKKWLITKLEEYLLPGLLKENIYLNNDELSTLITQLELLDNLLKLEINESFINKVRDLSPQFNAMISDRTGFIQIYLGFFSRLDELDKTETYYYLLKNVLMAGDHLENKNASNALNLILTSIEKYTSFDSENDMLDLDVELIIGTLFEKYGNRDRNPFNFYLTVGLNNVFAFNSSALVDKDNNPVKNFSYASEKIGMRINLYNSALRSSFDYQEKLRGHTYKKEKEYYKPDPIISNWHAIVFGSGLLYQLTDLSTQKNMNTSFLGFGTGLTFFNNMSINASLMIPIKQDESFQFRAQTFNIGFDIYFTEYLSALNKKRQQNKKAKMELEELKIKTQYQKASSEKTLKL